MLTILRLLIIAGACLLGGNQAHASCSPTVPPPTIYVGSDNKCDYATIQAAIDSVSTTATCAPNIVISAEHAWTAQQLTITNRSLSLIGTAGNCGVGGTTGITGAIDLPAATLTSPQVTISGAGHTGDSVISINGNSNVTLQYLEISGGNENDSGSHGGGIYFNATGSLTLNATTVDHNYAYYGAGIYFNGAHANGTDSTLYLNDYVEILNNTAQYSGGGVFIEGYAQMRMLSKLASTIAFNTARGINPSNHNATEGYGGGVRAIAPASAIIGSPGALVGAIALNSAVRGGGIAVDGGQSVGYAMILSTVANAPTSIDSNTASAAGGGIYLKEHYGV